MPYLLTLAWIIAIIYATIPLFWLVIHPFAERWRWTKIGARPLLGVTLLLINLATVLLTAPWRSLQFYATPWSWLGWAILFVIGAAMYSRIGHFGFDNLVGRTELEPQLQQRLVTTGMHARVRHPIYLAHLLMLTAWTVGSGLAVAFALWAIAILAGFFMIRAEDAELERRFGDEFREYKQRVPAMLFTLSSFLLTLVAYQAMVYGFAHTSPDASYAMFYFDPRFGIQFLDDFLPAMRPWPNAISWVTVAWTAGMALGIKRGWATLPGYIVSEAILSAPSVYSFGFIFWTNLGPTHSFSRAELVLPVAVFCVFTVLPLLIAVGQLRDPASKPLAH